MPAHLCRNQLLESRTIRGNCLDEAGGEAVAGAMRYLTSLSSINLRSLQITRIRLLDFAFPAD